MTLSRILIANRGEIALRIVRTARDLGATSILPYTPEDLMSPAAELADEAYALPEGSSYTAAAALLELARATGADAIHPGYGFLSEDADFARSIIEAGITWVGPSPEAMDALGDKMSARATAERAEVAPVPGITDLPPGALRATGHEVLVGTGTCAVRLGRLAPAGRNWMAADAWARGARPAPGAALGDDRQEPAR